MLKPITAMAVLGLLCGTAATAAPKAPATLARTEAGQVRGAVEKGVISWKGIPFAAPPVGDLRWRAPQPAARWAGVKQTTAYGHDCMQKPFGGDAAPLGTPPAEDCLYLNVWKPAGAAAGAKGKLPVMVWIYGGGFINGGASPPTYSGAQMAGKGVMFVSFNYRVGRFGAFAHPAVTAAAEDGMHTGDFGYLDELAAMKWVQRNIAGFGGDPANVTVIGESAGGGSVHMLMTSPLSKGLFKRAIIMSGGDGRMMADVTPAAAAKTAVAFGESKGVAGDDPDALRKLRALPADDVVDGLNLAQMFGGGIKNYMGPVSDGIVAVPVRAAYEAGQFNQVPVMIGATSADIGGPTGPMIAGARELSDLLSDKGVPVHHYIFSYVAQSLNAPGAGHASDIPFFFNTQAVKYGAATTARDNAMGDAISSYLANYARTGNPNGKGLPAWPAHTRSAPARMDFAADAVPQVH